MTIKKPSVSHFYSEGEEVSKILAEYDRLKAEVERLKQERDAYSERLHELRMEQVCHDCPIEDIKIKVEVSREEKSKLMRKIDDIIDKRVYTYMDGYADRENDTAMIITLCQRDIKGGNF